LRAIARFGGSVFDRYLEIMVNNFFGNRKIMANLLVFQKDLE